MSWKYYAFLTFISCVVFVAVGFVATKHRPVAKVSQESHWATRIQAIGPARAYAELAHDIAARDPDIQHTAAHEFGGALYAAEGLGAMAVCDSQFSYGCYHEFIGRALSAQGITILPQVQAGCDAAASVTGCRHGIGHGLLAHLGYSSDDLVKAVDICTQMGDRTMQGCYGGVFMEYMRTMSGSGNVRVANDSKYEPCDVFSGAAARSCMFYEPQWWFSMLFTDPRADVTPIIKKMVVWCASGSESDTCVQGVGLMVPPHVAYDPKRSAALCRASAATLNDAVYCASGAALVFAGTTGTTDAREVCSAFAGIRNEYCNAYAFGGDNPKLPTLP